MRKIISCVLITLLLFITGCLNAQTDLPTENAYSATDARGKIVCLNEEPQRIVSLGVSNDEIVMSLVPVDRIAAISDIPNNMPATAERIEGRVQSNLESVLSCRPDLIIGSDWLHPDFIQQVEASGIPVFLTSTPNSIQEIKNDIQRLGELLNAQIKAQELVHHIDKELSEINKKVQKGQQNGIKKPRAVYYSTNGVGGGIGSLFSFLCKEAGMSDATVEVGLQSGELLAKEALVDLAPDLIIIPGNEYDSGTYSSVRREELLNDPSLQTIPAIKNKKICTVNAKYIYSLNHYIVNAADKMATYWYIKN